MSSDICVSSTRSARKADRFLHLTVPKTDTGGRAEYAKAIWLNLAKELGNLAS